MAHKKPESPRGPSGILSGMSYRWLHTRITETTASEESGRKTAEKAAVAMGTATHSAAHKAVETGNHRYAHNLFQHYSVFYFKPGAKVSK